MDGLLLEIPNLDPSTRWLLLIAAVLTIFYAVMRPGRKKKDPLSRPALPVSLASQRAVERDMNNLLVELSEMARQITGQLDTRTLKLETLIKTADERIAALKAAEKNSYTPAASRSRPMDEPPEPEEPEEPEIDPRHVEVYTLADQGRSTQEISHRLSRPSGEVELILALRDKAARV